MGWVCLDCDVDVADVSGDQVGGEACVPLRADEAVLGFRRDDIDDAVNGGNLLRLDAVLGGGFGEVVGDLGALVRVVLVLPGGGSASAQRDPDALVLGLPFGSHEELLDAGGLAAGGLDLVVHIAVVVGVLQVRERAGGVLVNLHLGEGGARYLADQELGGEIGIASRCVPG